MYDCTVYIYMPGMDRMVGASLNARWCSVCPVENTMHVCKRMLTPEPPDEGLMHVSWSSSIYVDNDIMLC